MLFKRVFVLNYIILSFLCASIVLNASDERVRLSKRSSVVHIALKIEDDGSSNKGHILIKLAPMVYKQLSDAKQYHVKFARNKDLSSWAEHSYEFGSLERSLDQIEMVDDGILMTLSPLSISRIKFLQKKNCYAVALTAPLHEHEVQSEMKRLPVPQEPEMELKRQKSEELPSSSPIDKARRFLSLSFN